MQFRQAVLIVNRQTRTLQPGKANSFDEMYVDFQRQPENGGERWTVFLHPKQDLTIDRLEIQFDLKLAPDVRFFANGYQSWSESRLYAPNEKIARLLWPVRKYWGLYGDDHIDSIPRGRGQLHSWTYTYLSRYGFQNQDNIQFCGSLNESTGFTLLLYDHAGATLTVRKDMDGLQLGHSFPALDFWTGQGSEAEMFDRYFQMLGHAKPAEAPLIGWTSRGIKNLSETTIDENLDAFAGFCRGRGHSGFFQIDDGWQTAVGDWLSVSPAFPKGMAIVAQKIRSQGLSPGLWIAPFVAAKDSELARKHPDWLLKDKDGKPLRVGWNARWKGWYYALDFYNNEVRNHLGGVLHTVLDRWGFDHLKLDFLFAVCLVPPPGKTRGQVIFEALEFLRQLAGMKKIVASGVPLGAAFGLADYCHIGSDAGPLWEHRLLGWAGFRERAGALASLRSMLGRWQLNGRAFHCEPAAFTLSDERRGLQPVQQQTLLTVNALLGNSLVTSDPFAQYTPEQNAEFQAALDLQGCHIQALNDLQGDFYSIQFEDKGQRYFASLNLGARTYALSSTGKEEELELQPFETIILKR